MNEEIDYSDLPEYPLWEEISDMLRYDDHKRRRFVKMVIKELELKSFEEVEELIK